jgi:hypothetical protein
MDEVEFRDVQIRHFNTILNWLTAARNLAEVAVRDRNHEIIGMVRKDLEERIRAFNKRADHAFQKMINGRIHEELLSGEYEEKSRLIASKLRSFKEFLDHVE